MFVKDMFRRGRPVVSFEIFPPRGGVPVEEVYRTLGAIRDLKPDFVSVTYGAGGRHQGLHAGDSLGGEEPVWP
ncbi:methylenetetrahydrofolate reductase [Thermanaerovibrio velox]|uniref:methylenetetrahydrofolate reductase n=1 Tax=Thermanaerovibrio velox TaxID=108007 RepID=UPI0002E38C96|nr:methylenetetrahydrofolate reductase [Thermanaerovibrio velox]